jgi:ribosomal protein S18 acetylase RimI-like enzyme
MSGATLVAVRVLRAADVASVIRLCARVFPESKDRFGSIAECASRKKAHRNSIGLVAKAGPRVIGVLCCQILEDPVLAPGKGPVAHVDVLAVHPKFRRRGIATALWRRMEARLRSRGIASAWTRSRGIRWGVDVIRHPEAVVFFLKVGFEKRHDIYDMTAHLDGLDFDTRRAESRLRREGIVVKRTEYCERDDLARFLSSVFPNWLSTVDRVPAEGPQCVHIARTSEKVIGFAASAGLGFGPIGVDPQCRMKGIGKVLLLRCLRDVRDRGHRTALIGWANFPFYARSISAPITRVMWQMEKRIGSDQLARRSLGEGG